jgi:hypothetical protein
VGRRRGKAYCSKNGSVGTFGIRTRIQSEELEPLFLHYLSASGKDLMSLCLSFLIYTLRIIFLCIPGPMKSVESCVTQVPSCS